MRRDIDEVIQGWPFDPSPGEVAAREIRARDGRTVLQIRVELGLLQLEVEGRPDGHRPHGFATYLDYLRHRSAGRDVARDEDHPAWSMQPEHRIEADREFVQYYHRRVAWLALQRYENAAADADHTLALMNFVSQHAHDEEYVATHERFRCLVLFHRTQARAATALERRRPEEAIDAIRDGLDRIAEHAREFVEDSRGDETPHEALAEQLRLLEREIRRNFAVAKTLREQLDEAVQREDYERAARLRDQIRHRAGR